MMAPSLIAADIEVSKESALSMSHSLNWVRKHAMPAEGEVWDGVLDEAKWGVPSPQQAISRNWDFRLSDAQWHELVKTLQEEPSEPVRFDLWVPGDVKVFKGVVAISAHGSGKQLYEHATLRKMARELGLALLRFEGNPVQRGFWPQSLFFEQLQALSAEAGHPEIANAPLFLYGHSNGTGFSAIFAARAPDRVWGWVSMRPGTTFQVYQPQAAMVPGLVIFGENDPFLERPSKAENLDVVPALRRRSEAIWAQVVEPEGGHGPGEETWALVFSFLRESFAARVPADCDLRQGPCQLAMLDPKGHDLGQNWAVEKGGYQVLEIAPASAFTGERARASWLVSPRFARDWQAFQRDGKVAD